VTSDNPLGDAVLLLLEHLRNSRSDEERRLLEIAGGASAFLSFTGQLYRFEDFRESPRADRVESLSFAQAIRHLEQLRARVRSTPEEEALRTASDALVFIESSGQHEEFEDYLRYWRGSTLPPVVAAFQTREQADAWLERQPVPPYKARVLIGDEYHMVLATREDREWPFARMPVVAEFIERQLRKGLPPVVAVFDTREEAEAWLGSTPAPPRHAFITVNGEHHLAACWENVSHRALYPFTLAEELEKERQASPRRLGSSETEGEKEPT
jgi:hypothetical protein